MHWVNSMEYFQVVNWDEFQHYKDRNPPWIKLHNQLLDNYDFCCLQDASKAHLLCIWMIASRTGNKIPLNSDWLKGKIGATQNIDLEELLASGFIEKIVGNQSLRTVEHNASKVISESKQVAIPEESRAEGETEQRERQNTTLFTEFWSIYPGPRKKDKPLTKTLFNKQNQSTQELIINHIKHRSLNDPEWTKENGQFIPGPVPFLRQSGWTDEYRVNELSGFSDKAQESIRNIRDYIDEHPNAS